jgi:hypothetical protein
LLLGVTEDIVVITLYGCPRVEHVCRVERLEEVSLRKGEEEEGGGGRRERGRENLDGMSKPRATIL